MTPTPGGSLLPIDQSNWRAALEVRVTDEQLAMVADHQPVALVILAKAYLQPGNRSWEPLAYVLDGSVVAVLALAHAKRVSEVINLAVDVNRQHSGIGTVVMRSALVRAKNRGSTSVELTVHPSNEAAAALYRRVGFSPTGEQRDGEDTWVRAVS